MQRDKDLFEICEQLLCFDWIVTVLFVSSDRTRARPTAPSVEFLCCDGLIVDEATALKPAQV